MLHNQEYNNNNELSNEDFIIRFRKEIEGIINEYGPLAKAFRLLNEDIEKFKEFKLLYSFMVMSNFKKLTEMQWLIKVDEERQRIENYSQRTE
ncbi:unnamed protein product [marine sediment metagenome]|uniref:Uncharacterized protein n=1 Tax=marine sediment metagenome TaxID=412755 RepID=X0Z1J5_9ZZZZ